MPDDVEVGEPIDDDALVRLTAAEALDYFESDVTHNRGLVRDSADPRSPCSVAAAGFAAAALAAGESMGLLARDDALRRCLDIARAFRDAPMATATADADDAAGFRGFYYHFLEAEGPARGRRAWKSELSTVDTALLVVGLLAAAGHFVRDDEREHELREAADLIYRRVEWPWMLRPGGRIGHGWRPEAVRRPRKDHGRDGFIVHEWDGYSEGLLLYILALGSPTHPVPPESYDAWAETYPRDWRSVYGVEHLHCPPLFVHQFPHAFFDLRGVADAFLCDRGVDYFENARRATLAQIEHAKRNPGGFGGYAGDRWGISASNGPGILHDTRLTRDGRRLRFSGYVERGLPPPGGVVDDGTLAPWAAAACLPYLPEATLAAIRGHRHVALCRPDWIGFMGSYNLTYVADDCPYGWADEHDLAIEQAPIVMMAANHTGDAIWSATRRQPWARRGLRAAGMTGGWLGG